MKAKGGSLRNICESKRIASPSFGGAAAGQEMDRNGSPHVCVSLWQHFRVPPKEQCETPKCEERISGEFQHIPKKSLFTCPVVL